MKKFITTSKNEIFIEGKLLESSGDNSLYPYEVYGVPCDINIDEWLEKGWIKKVEKSEYTKSDMFDWFNFVDSHHIGCNPNLEGIFRDYLKQR